MPELADKLINDIKWLPLWSNIYSQKFQYARIPASSAPVEIEFNTVKNKIFKLFSKQVRVDQFIQEYHKYLTGKIKIIDARTQENEKSNQK